MECNHIEIMNQPLNELFQLLTCETHRYLFFLLYIALWSYNKRGWISLKELSLLSVGHSPVISFKLIHQP